MKVNTNSWHYRLNRYTWGNEIPEHLCPYVRLLLFNITIGWWLQLLSNNIHLNLELPQWGVMKFMIKHPMIFNIEVFYSLWAMIGFWQLLTGNITGGIINMSITGCSYIAVKTMGRGVKFFEGKSNTFKTISEKSVVLQSVKSNHNKICPKLDFIDNKIVQFNEEVYQIKEPELEGKQVIKKDQKDNLLKTDYKEK